MALVTKSLLSRGAWIEIQPEIDVLSAASVSLLSRGAWIEMSKFSESPNSSGSLLSRGAWIEIPIIFLSKYLGARRSSHEERGLKYYYV